uniref:Tr-type G domain-containing protein n=1 Tax=Tetranychus urticae TaxID=32264 RepID=T1KTL5_TETUR
MVVEMKCNASLIKTIISGTQIIDLMLLVIDVTKGLQTQTAECLVIGEITCNQLIVVLNKIDLLPESTRSEAIEKMTQRMAKKLSKKITFEINLEKTLGKFLFYIDHCFSNKDQGAIMTCTVTR